MTFLSKKQDYPHFLGSSVLEIDKNIFDKIKFSNGKPDLIGVIIFSEIASCYQLSLNLIRDNQDNTFLNKSYLEFSKEFSLTKRQVTESITRLEYLGIIERNITMLQVGKKIFPNTVLIKITQKGRGILNGTEFNHQINASDFSQKKLLRVVSNKNSLHPNKGTTFERDIPFEREPYIYINNINNIIKQTNKQAGTFSFEKNLDKKERGEIQINSFNPTSLNLLHFEEEKEKWGIWAKEELYWDPKTIFSEIKRFFNYHTERHSLFLDWFSAWKKWCQMSFNKFKKSFSGTLSETVNFPEEDHPRYQENLTQTTLESVKEEIKEKLKKFEIIGLKAETLLEKFDAARILKNIAYVTAKLEDGKGVQNKSGYLLKSIYEDYAKDFEENSGDSLEVLKTPSMILQEEENLLLEIEEEEGSGCVKRIRQILLKTFGAGAYKVWLRTVKMDMEKGKSLILKASSPFMRDWIENNMKGDIEKALKNLFSEIDIQKIEFVSC